MAEQTPLAKYKVRTLKKIGDARRCLADAIRRYERELDVDPSLRLATLTRACTALGQLVRDAEMEARLARIEREMQLPAWTLRNRVKIDPRRPVTEGTSQ